MKIWVLTAMVLTLGLGLVACGGDGSKGATDWDSPEELIKKSAKYINGGEWEKLLQTCTPTYRSKNTPDLLALQYTQVMQAFGASKVKFEKVQVKLNGDTDTATYEGNFHGRASVPQPGPPPPPRSAGDRRPRCSGGGTGPLPSPLYFLPAVCTPSACALGRRCAQRRRSSGGPAPPEGPHLSGRGLGAALWPPGAPLCRSWLHHTMACWRPRFLCRVTKDSGTTAT